MAMSEYMRRLREKVGHDYILIPAAGALIRDDAGRVLLVQHVDGPWTVPGGQVDPDEHPEETVRRECKEEASIDVRVLGVAGVFGGPESRTRYANGDEVGVVGIIFEAEIVGGTPAPGDDETQAVGWFAPDELEGVELRRSVRHRLSALLG